MKIQIVLTLQTQLLNGEGDDRPDPEPGSREWEQARTAALHGVQNALERAEMMGFVHELGDLMTIEVDDVVLAGN